MDNLNNSLNLFFDNTINKKREKTKQETKDLLVKLVLQDGISISEASRVLNLNKSTARSIIAKHKNIEQGNQTENNLATEVMHLVGRPSKITPAILEAVEKIVTIHSTCSLETIRQRLSTDLGIELSTSSIFNALKTLKITLKRVSRQLDRVNCISTIEKMRIYARDFSVSAPIDRKKCIFIDESGFNLHMRRTFGRSITGKRAITVVPTVRGRKITLIVATNTEKIIHYKIISTSTCNAEKFNLFISELMSKISNDAGLHGSFITMDNARIHGRPETQIHCTRFQCQLKFLSPYSYMLNPVEHIFSKIKCLVRNILSASFENHNLISLIDDAILNIREQDLNGYFSNMLRNISLAIDGRNFD